MGYEIALSIAWDEILKLSLSSKHIVLVPFLNRVYEVKLSDRAVTCQTSRKPAEDYLALLILHYIIGLCKHGYRPSGDWISFKDIWGGDSYFPAYRKNTIRPIIGMLQKDPELLLKNMIENLKGKIVDGGDISVELITFPDIFIRILIWRGDDEFSPEATMLFDRALADILTTEDIAVLLDCIAQTIIEYK
jgi:hypothetical protein